MNDTWTSLKFRAPSNFSNDEAEFTCQITNSEGIAKRAFKVTLKRDFGIYVAFGIAIGIIAIIFCFLLRYVYLTKVIYLFGIVYSIVNIKREKPRGL